MKLFKVELKSYEDRFQIWFAAEEHLTKEDFGQALSSAILKVFNSLEDTVPDSSKIKKDYPLFVFLFEDLFYEEMEKRGFKKLEADVEVSGDSYSVLWETPQGKKRITLRSDAGSLENFLLTAGVEKTEEDPEKIFFGEQEDNENGKL